MMLETAEPTLGLRFWDGRLQQQWLIRGVAPYTEWRDVPQCQLPESQPPKWRSLVASDLELSLRAYNAMGRMVYDRTSRMDRPATLGEVADMTDAEILRTPFCGRKTLKELRAMVAKIQALEVRP